jgi:cysteine desulfuration protein SufE
LGFAAERAALRERFSALNSARGLFSLAPGVPRAYMAGQAMTTIEQITADFDLLDNWEDRYRYLIELGRALPALPEVDRTEANKVRGCASQVWLATHLERGAAGDVLHFDGDSDAMIVRGLVAIAMALFDRKTPGEILATDAEAAFSRLDLRAHLTAQRSNGLRSLVDRIRKDAEAAIAGDPAQSIVGR